MRDLLLIILLFVFTLILVPITLDMLKGVILIFALFYLSFLIIDKA